MVDEQTGTGQGHFYTATRIQWYTKQRCKQNKNHSKTIQVILKYKCSSTKDLIGFLHLCSNY
jgi:hypothetical protein